MWHVALEDPGRRHTVNLCLSPGKRPGALHPVKVRTERLLLTLYAIMQDKIQDIRQPSRAGFWE
jgi:hypothetical protein